MRILAVDYGEKRTGLAVSDELGITAQGLDTLIMDNEEDIPAAIAKVAEEYNAGTILFGLPLNMNGSESEKSLKVREVAARAGELSGRSVEFLDERMTSLRAEQVMRDMGRKTKNGKHIIDRLSATILLQDYLQARGYERP